MAMMDTHGDQGSTGAGQPQGKPAQGGGPLPRELVLAVSERVYAMLMDEFRVESERAARRGRTDEWKQGGRR